MEDHHIKQDLEVTRERHSEAGRVGGGGGGGGT